MGLWVFLRPVSGRGRKSRTQESPLFEARDLPAAVIERDDRSLLPTQKLAGAEVNCRDNDDQDCGPENLVRDK